AVTAVDIDCASKSLNRYSDRLNMHADSGSFCYEERKRYRANGACSARPTICSNWRRSPAECGSARQLLIQTWWALGKNSAINLPPASLYRLLGQALPRGNPFFTASQ